ncbi:ribbon-helix-helix protein, CopG family [Kribbella sp. NPDC059898]|uniref:ribbon-helix-helix protein, CopG family n=1 Tax=Kribbella sp. NPDC059898 TaxID=3346995 RepID=UPI003649B791
MARKGPKPPRIVVGVRLDPPERDALQRLAAADGETSSDLAREAIRRYLSERRADLELVAS